MQSIGTVTCPPLWTCACSEWVPGLQMQHMQDTPVDLPMQ